MERSIYNFIFKVVVLLIMKFLKIPKGDKNLNGYSMKDKFLASHANYST